MKTLPAWSAVAAVVAVAGCAQTVPDQAGVSPPVVSSVVPSAVQATVDEHVEAMLLRDVAEMLTAGTEPDLVPDAFPPDLRSLVPGQQTPTQVWGYGFDPGLYQVFVHTGPHLDDVPTCAEVEEVAGGLTSRCLRREELSTGQGLLVYATE